eukprot:4951474-Prymnesium_polylepis.1
MSKPQLLKRKWSEDMTRNVRAYGSRDATRKYAKAVAKKCVKARGESFALKLRTANMSGQPTFWEA